MNKATDSGQIWAASVSKIPITAAPLESSSSEEGLVSPDAEHEKKLTEVEKAA